MIESPRRSSHRASAYIYVRIVSTRRTDASPPVVLYNCTRSAPDRKLWYSAQTRFATVRRRLWYQVAYDPSAMFDDHAYGANLHVDEKRRL
jgi:hypothetical protein